MKKITIGVLTISDRCSNKEMADESGSNLIRLIKEGIVKNGILVERDLVPDERPEIEWKLRKWCDEKKINVILTTGGTGLAPRDVTPEATNSLLEKKTPGISNLILNKSLDVTPLAALSRGESGIRGKSLIVNLPGSKKASEECLRWISPVIPHAVDLICDAKEKVERIHSDLFRAGEDRKRKSAVRMKTEEERNRKWLYQCLKVSEAQQIVLGIAATFGEKKWMDFDNVLGHVLATDVKAVDNLPPFDSSLKDGYAVISSDVTSSRKLLGSCPAGATTEESVMLGCCMSVNTGAPLPPGSDAVVQVEDTRVSRNSCTTEIEIVRFPASGENVRPVGYDFKKGDLLVPAGTQMEPCAVGLLAAAGVLSVEVFARPMVAVMSTGDEVVDPQEKPGPGQIRDSNRITLMGMLKEEGFEAADLGIVKDEPDALLCALSAGFETCDLVVTTGSMSMGDRDYLKEVLIADFDAEIHFGAVFMKPGKPTGFATLTYRGKRKMWFGLPGNPASAVVTTHLFLLPALRRISGYRDVLPSRVEAVVSFDIELLDRPHYHRGVLRYEKGKFEISTTGNQSSSRVGSCVGANCLVEIPDGNGFVRAGTEVTALLIGKYY